MKKSRLIYSTEEGRIKPKPGRRSVSAPATQAQGVRIRREKKGRGGKTVSVITGLSLPPDGLEDLLCELKHALGTGGAVKNGRVEVQGDHRDRLLAMLAKRGIKARTCGG